MSEDFSTERLEREAFAEEIKRTPAEPEPLRRKTPPPKPYPVHALGSLLGDAARALHRVNKAPLALCGQSFLAAACLAAQPHADVEIDKRIYPLTLWFITIAESGERKSGTDSVALEAHRKYERSRHAAAEREMPRYQAKLAAYDAAMKQAKNKKTHIEIHAAIEALGPAPAPPPCGILIATEPTVEAIQKIYLSGVPSLGLFSDEGAAFFGGHSMSKDHALRTIGAFSKLWDDGSSERLRATDGQRKIYGRRLAMHMLMQPVVAEGVLSDPLLSGQGFLPRCLLAWPDTTAGTRLYVEESAADEPAVRRFGARMGDLLHRAPKLREDSAGELEPRRLSLSWEAKATWIHAYNAIEKEMAPTGAFAQVRPWASKAAEQILRIAGVLTIVDDPDAPQIYPQAIRDASEIVAWHMSEVLRLIDTAKVPTEVRNAEKVLEWYRAKGIEIADAKMLMNRGPNCVRSKDSLAAAMNVLVLTGHMELRPNVLIESRKAKKAWAICNFESQESQKSPGSLS